MRNIVEANDRKADGEQLAGANRLRMAVKRSFNQIRGKEAITIMSKPRPTMPSRFNLDDPDLLRKFKMAANALSSRSLKSKRSARAALVKDGILTKTGRLTKNYSR